MDRILVIGGTGNIGSQVLSALSSAGVSCRALVRNPDSVNLPELVEAIPGDLTVPETLDRCLDGVDKVFLVWTAPGAAVAAALDRIAKHARHIVFLSAPLKTPHPFFQQPNPARALAEEIERRIESSGLAWTYLRPGMLASNAPGWWAPQLRSGDTVRWPYLDVPTAPIDERDIAAVAVRTLMEGGHAGAEYVLTGPESLTQREQLMIIAQATGRTLQLEDLSPEQARRELSATFPPAVLTMLLDAWAAGAGQPAFVTSTVEAIAGRAARTFLQWATDHAGEFKVDATG